MKRKVEAASSPSMLELILMKTHPQKKLLKLGRNEDEDDQKDKVEALPTDLEVEILSRLPSKSLMKLRCVSKIWSSIIRSQRFVDSFYALSSTRSRFTVAFSSGIYALDATRRLFIFSSSFEEEDLSSSPSSLVAKLDMIIPSVSRTYPYRCPSIHGFVGCANTSKFIVCNPSTKQVITLPIQGDRASLGYDPVGRQFKVLNLVTGPGEFRSYLVHEFITLGAGGEVSRNQVTTANYVPVTDGVYINGSLYFAAWSPKLRMDPVVVTLDTRP
ncbi:PREDICTED: F-box protein At1g30790-like [Camelina sativa]|uniref:F-box protein At1g30790-like n=1 Tax=Camelina sativa TaxID=90675 RepID=A0ABM0X4H9_CAMSA|nr:PREDICTED: F-box protein At1g30790-like [Camelina sativa]